MSSEENEQNEESAVKETIKEMARLTMLTDKLNDVQIKNLKMFPFIFFDGIQELVIDYDLSNNLAVDTTEDQANLNIDYKFATKADHLRVTYHLTLEKSIVNHHLDQRFRALEGSIHNLLWKDIKVQVFFNGVKAYETNNEPK